MKWFNNQKIGTRIVIGFVVVIVIAAIIGGLGIFTSQTINTSYAGDYTDSSLVAEVDETISSSFQRIRMNMYAAISSNTSEQRDTHLERIEEQKAEVYENLAQYKAMLDSHGNDSTFDEEKGKLANTKASFDAYVASLDNLMKQGIMDPERKVEAYDMLGGTRDLALQMDEAIAILIKHNTDFSVQQIAANSAKALESTIIIIVVAVVGIIIAIVLGIYISRNISKRTATLVEAADMLAVGDVNITVTKDFNDEIGDLIVSFENMIENIRSQAQIAEKIADGDLTVKVIPKSDKDLLGLKLKELVDKNNEAMSNIAIASDQVATGAQQISDASITLSQGATEQASSVEELSASMEEISVQINQNTQNANEANKMANDAKNDADIGNRQMAEMLVAMADINESSNNISKIIKVIDEIAFQTNILALNAAVEAARAGQHGKGFAVVAEEVRNLAARSADAAKETTEMIENSIRKVDDGTKIANETAEALTKIVKEVEHVAGLLNDIANASNEQSTGIAQVNQGIIQISQVVQNNSATSEEAAASSEELASQAELLKAEISKFKLDVASKGLTSNTLEKKNIDLGVKVGNTGLGKY